MVEALLVASDKWSNSPTKIGPKYKVDIIEIFICSLPS